MIHVTFIFFKKTRDVERGVPILLHYLGSYYYHLYIQEKSTRVSSHFFPAKPCLNRVRGTIQSLDCRHAKTVPNSARFERRAAMCRGFPVHHSRFSFIPNPFSQSIIFYARPRNKPTLTGPKFGNTDPISEKTVIFISQGPVDQKYSTKAATIRREIRTFPSCAPEMVFPNRLKGNTHQASQF